MGIRSGIRRAKGINLSKRVNKSNKRPTQKKVLVPDHNDWDKTKSTNSNYVSFGLIRNVNADNSTLAVKEKKGEEPKTELDLDEVGEVDLKALQALNKANKVWETSNPKLKKLMKADVQEGVKELKAKRKPQINRDEREALKNLLKKYGNDFNKMRRDVKLNTFQWTESQCRKKIQELVKKEGKEELLKYVSDKDLELMLNMELD